MPSKHQDLAALKQLQLELERVLKAGPLPKTIEARTAELFRSIHALTDDLITRSVVAYDRPAAMLGSRGGIKTAERGPEYYKKIAGMRKTKAGGRPRNEDINKS